MRIESGYPVGGAMAAKRRGRAGAAGSFSLEAEAGSVAGGAVAGLSLLGGPEALLALQGIDPDQGRRRQAVDHGRDLLDSLESLRVDLIGGRLDGDRLERLAAILRRKADHSRDPQLAAILAEIELRAHVELAKLGKSCVF